MVDDERRRSGKDSSKDSSRIRGMLRSARSKKASDSSDAPAVREIGSQGKAMRSGKSSRSSGTSSRNGNSLPSRLRSVIDSEPKAKTTGRSATVKHSRSSEAQNSHRTSSTEVPRGAAVPKKMRAMGPARSGNHGNASREKQAQAIRHGRSSAVNSTRGTTNAERARRLPPTSSQASRGGPLPRSIRNNQDAHRTGIARYMRNKKLVVTVSVVLVLLIALLGTYIVLKNALTKMDAQNSAPSESANFEPVKCTPQMLEVSLARQGSRPGQAVNFNISIKNDKGERPCFVDIGYKHAGIKVWSGEQPVWDSKACSVGDASKVLLLDKNLTSTQTITWDGNVYGANCAKQYPSKAGTYQAQFVIDDVDFGAKIALSLDPNGKNAQAVTPAPAPVQNQPTVQPSPDPNVKSDVDGNGSAVDKADPESYKKDAPSDVTSR